MTAPMMVANWINLVHLTPPPITQYGSGNKCCNVVGGRIGAQVRRHHGDGASARRTSRRNIYRWVHRAAAWPTD
jgi:uncharacterized protein YbcC (UPF0753/DUF2309 family)